MPPDAVQDYASPTEAYDQDVLSDADPWPDADHSAVMLAEPWPDDEHELAFADPCPDEEDDLAFAEPCPEEEHELPVAESWPEIALPAAAIDPAPAPGDLHHAPDQPPPVSEGIAVDPAHAQRVLDVVLTVLLLPVAAVVVGLAAAVVRLTSRGPAFYAQTRLGRGGRPFRLLKLRTMYHDCEAASGPRWSCPGDPRVTPLGRLLRRTHVDELPQLWNVLCGDMSLVGPRPERPEVIAAAGLDRLVPGYAGRLRVRPGLTGPAQLLLPPDADVDGVRAKVAYDRDYVDRRTVALDLRVLAATAPALLGVGPGLLRWLLGVPALHRPAAVPAPPGPAAPPPGEAAAWRDELTALLAGGGAPAADESRMAEAERWLRATARPALARLATEFRVNGRRARVTAGPRFVRLQVWGRDGWRELDLTVLARPARSGVNVIVRELVRDEHRLFVREQQQPGATALAETDVIRLVLERYRARATQDPPRDLLG